MVTRNGAGGGCDPGTIYPIDQEEKFPTVQSIGQPRADSKLVVVEDQLLRQPEWQEAALAQGFPEDYLFVGSQSDAAQMVANAVQIDTARAILTSICRDAGLVS